MTADEAKKVIVEECLKPGGFAFAIRENRVDQQAYVRLVDAIGEVSREVTSSDQIDRLLIACLFELPWEIENTVEHYSSQSDKLGATVAMMAEELRTAINNLLWRGLESNYESET